MMKFATKQAEIRYMKGVTSRQRPISTWMKMWLRDSKNYYII